MTAGDDAAPIDAQPAAGALHGAPNDRTGSADSADRAVDDCTDTVVDPASPASPDEPGERRRKAGVHYRPV